MDYIPVHQPPDHFHIFPDLPRGRWQIKFSTIHPAEGCVHTDKSTEQQESIVCSFSLEHWLFISLLPQYGKDIY